LNTLLIAQGLFHLVDVIDKVRNN